MSSLVAPANQIFSKPALWARAKLTSALQMMCFWGVLGSYLLVRSSLERDVQAAGVRK